jgi:ubiquitin carboxyl-terminal hydrolase L5
MLQVIPNACATQAILSVLLNAEDKLQLGSTLSDFLSFTRDFPPDLKGLAISNSDQIRTVHNGFSRQDPFVHEKSDDQDDDKDAYHFIAYLPHKGKVSLL